MYYTLFSSNEAMVSRRAEQSSQDIRCWILLQFFQSLIDLSLVIPCYLLLLLSHRHSTVRSEINLKEQEVAPHVADPTHLRQVIWRQFLNLLVDLPFICMGLLACSTLIHIMRLKDDILKTTILTQRRQACLKHFGQWLLDVPVLISFCLSTVLFYRFRTMRQRLADLHWDFFAGFTCYFIVFETLGSYLLDLPFICVGLVSCGLVVHEQNIHTYTHPLILKLVLAQK